MFSPFSIFILLVSAVIALLIDIFDPFANLTTYLKGKTTKQVSDEADQVFYILDENGEKVLGEDGDPKINWKKAGSKAGGWCTGACLYLAIAMPLSWFITFVIEPIYIIDAITKSIGNIYLAYAMLGIILIAGFNAIKAIVSVIKAVFAPKPDENVPGPNASDQERIAYQVRRDMEKEAQEKKVSVTSSSWFMGLLRRVFFAFTSFALHSDLM